MPNICIIGGSRPYQEMFKKQGHSVSSLDDADLICLTGGPDVKPSRYNQKPHIRTNFDELRDKADERAFQYAVKKGIPIVGICRGGQFLNVENGGSMYQHVDGHTQPHNLVDLQEGKVIGVTSTHHQMMIPLEDRAVVVAVAEGQSRKREKMNVYGGCLEKVGHHPDVEVLFYPDTLSLCFQPHPEFHGADSTRNYFFELIERYFGEL